MAQPEGSNDSLETPVQEREQIEESISADRVRQAVDNDTQEVERAREQRTRQEPQLTGSSILGQALLAGMVILAMAGGVTTIVEYGVTLVTIGIVGIEIAVGCLGSVVIMERLGGANHNQQLATQNQPDIENQITELTNPYHPNSLLQGKPANTANLEAAREWVTRQKATSRNFSSLASNPYIREFSPSSQQSRGGEEPPTPTETTPSREDEESLTPTETTPLLNRV